MKSFVKKLIYNVESENGVVLDEFYEQYANYMISMKVSVFVVWQVVINVGLLANC